ncbi:hypothetical protein JDV02_004407 [Purpureocillium takamizusanense]|uniref:RING-type domain-containing protein n=1 Tax=Purpureocillium takamizusanense TaxID=2060973 RepID=A0A9Q8QF60_9HYPO|nr:uncharacterized protein JDV02_004407 [Purpureocillium takamizusanense]UNI18117.1 hypothetical protein JDV02_004407 [Purpureocillium takamizusanense]
MASPDANSTTTTAATSNSPTTIWVPILVVGCTVFFLAAFVYTSHRFVICATGRDRSSTRDLESADELSIVKRLNKAACSQLYSAWKEICRTDETAAVREPDAEPGPADCAICLETLQDADVVRALPCKHVFHSECLLKWAVARHDSCPLCKARFYGKMK